MKTSIFAKAAAVTAFAVIAATGLTAPSEFVASADEELPVTSEAQTAVSESTDAETVESTYSAEVSEEENAEKSISFSVVTACEDGSEPVTKVYVTSGDGKTPDLSIIPVEVLENGFSIESDSCVVFDQDCYDEEQVKETLSDEDYAEYKRITEELKKLYEKIEELENNSPDAPELNELFDEAVKLNESFGSILEKYDLNGFVFDRTDLVISKTVEESNT